METVTTRDLRKIRALLARPFGWTKGCDRGRKINKKDEFVNCYCLRGAMYHVADTGGRQHSIRRLLEEAIWELFPKFKLTTMVTFNDAKSTTKKDVLKVVDHAIKLSMGQR